MAISYVGEIVMLDNWLGVATPEAQTLKLYSNNITPAQADVAGSYTEVSGGGYAAISLVRATWGAAATVANVTTKAYPAQTFMFTSARTVYGYFIVGASSGTLYWAELLYSGGQVFGPNNDTLVFTPKMQGS